MNDYKEFQSNVSDMDQRLATIVCTAFEDCSSCTSCLKLIEIFGSILERPLIHRDFQHKYPKLLAMYNCDLDDIKTVFDRQLTLMDLPSGPVVNKNYPEVAGMMVWCHELRERSSENISKLKAINHGTMESAEAMMVYNKFDEMMQLIAQ